MWAVITSHFSLTFDPALPPEHFPKSVINVADFN